MLEGGAGAFACQLSIESPFGRRKRLSHLTAWTESSAWPRSVYPDHYRGQDTAIFAKALEGRGMDVRLRDWYAK